MIVAYLTVFAGVVVQKDKRKLAQYEEADCAQYSSQAERTTCEDKVLKQINHKLTKVIKAKCENSASVQEFSPDGTGYAGVMIRCKAQIMSQLIDYLEKASVD